MKHMRAGAAAALMTLSVLGTEAAATAAPLPRLEAAKRRPAGKALAQPTFVRGQFAPYAPGNTAVTYDPALVPVGAVATVASLPSDEGTYVMLRVWGLAPDHTYEAHAHLAPCGPRGDDAGPRYQAAPAPTAPADASAGAQDTDPRNQIWLGLRTDARGDGLAYTVVNWQFTDRHARSVVIRAEPTQLGTGRAGSAGAPVACLDVDF